MGKEMKAKSSTFNIYFNPAICLKLNLWPFLNHWTKMCSLEHFFYTHWSHQPFTQFWELCILIQAGKLAHTSPHIHPFGNICRAICLVFQKKKTWTFNLCFRILYPLFWIRKYPNTRVMWEFWALLLLFRQFHI